MPMPPYEILCQTPACARPAVFKIASRWSDGGTRELKTYFLTCEECRDACLRQAAEKKQQCRLTAGETLSEPEAFGLIRGRRDQELRGTAAG